MAYARKSYRSTKLKGYSKKTKPYSRYKKKGFKSTPSRFRYSKSSGLIAKEVSKQLNKVAENRFVGIHRDCLPVTQKPAGNQKLSYIFLNTGTQLNASVDPTVSFKPMEAFTYQPNVERTGRYLYLKTCHLKFEIQMLPITTQSLAELNSTTTFRFMVIKQSGSNHRIGEPPRLSNSIWLQPNNAQFGINDTTRYVQEYNQQPINKRNWQVFCDKKFTLSPPSQVLADTQSDVNTANPHYPVRKMININLPCWKKVLYGDGDFPIDFDSQWMIICQASPTSYCSASATRPVNWTMSYIGTTSANDS